VSHDHGLARPLQLLPQLGFTFLSAMQLIHCVPFLHLGNIHVLLQRCHSPPQHAQTMLRTTRTRQHTCVVRPLLRSQLLGFCKRRLKRSDGS
jgi:hypothetical protein